MYKQMLYAFTTRWQFLFYINIIYYNKYPNGIEAQKEKLEAEGHTIIQKGRKNINYGVIILKI